MFVWFRELPESKHASRERKCTKRVVFMYVEAADSIFDEMPRGYGGGDASGGTARYLYFSDNCYLHKCLASKIQTPPKAIADIATIWRFLNVVTLQR